ncbi:MAG: 3'(2'),5'-bisphosphate nucleotidase [Cryomorphaceae bacterium]|nr:MAG: 3'(2'),5'-bisphosphate nucleotidase [Cryomorphaceae bacterium]
MELLDVAIGAAIRAGTAIMHVYDTAFKVDVKSDQSPLTKADRDAHRVISEQLQSTGLPVLSEEGRDVPYEERKQWKRFWMVDPLDGTKEFIKRNGEFTVNIALIEDNRAIAGVIFVPVSKVLYAGWVGASAWKFKLTDRRLSFLWRDLTTVGERLPIIQHTREYRIVGSRSHPSPDTEAFIERCMEKYDEVRLVSMGSSLKICLVAEGQADVYPRFAPTMEWDTAAGHAIAKAAGKNITDHMTQSEMEYNKPYLLNNWFVVE